jgi:predicted alpha/beta-fold hydrolase
MSDQATLRQQSEPSLRYHQHVASCCDGRDRGNPLNYLVGGTAIQQSGVIAQLRMNRRLARLIFFRVSVLLGCVALLSEACAQAKMSPRPKGLGKEFASETARVNGITPQYVRGGKGPAVILIHGFPQDWFEYHAIMPRFAKQFTVIAVDLRGVGGSTAAPVGYDAANMAEDVHQLAAVLKLERIYVVGHDIGGMVAYAFVRRIRRLLVER